METWRFYIISLLLFSCEYPDGCEEYNWITPEFFIIENNTYNYTIGYDYPNKEELEYYLNYTYFNRYNINIALIDKADFNIKIVYNTSYLGSYDGQIIEVRNDRIFSSTTAHEIVHFLGVLQHVDPKTRDYQNLMYPSPSECGERYYLNEEQLKIIKKI